jgi:hypothetical protein
VRVEITVVSFVFTFVRVKITMSVKILTACIKLLSCEWKLHYACLSHTRECHHPTHTGQNHTLRVKITLVRVEVTFVLVEITLRIEFTLFVY